MRTAPVLFVVDRDPRSLEGLVSDLSSRFGNDFDVRGQTSLAREGDGRLAQLREVMTRFSMPFGPGDSR